MTDELQTFIIFFVAIAAIVGISVGITLYSRRDACRRLESMRRRYTGETQGTVVEIARPRNTSAPTIITVSYEVEGRSYTIRERLKMTAPGTETGGFFITVKKVPAIQLDGPGTPVRVVFQPSDPKYAMIAGNEGVMEY